MIEIAGGILLAIGALAIITWLVATPTGNRVIGIVGLIILIGVVVIAVLAYLAAYA